MPATRFTALCEAVIEASWLAVLGITPLFFNVYSTRVFEPEKASLVRALALVMAAAWLAKAACGGPLYRPGRRGGVRADASLLAVPLLVPALLLVAVELLASGFSIDRRLSWSGSFFRLQGTQTDLAYVVMFLLVLGHLRSAGQWRRVRLAVVVSGVAVGSYGLLQRFGLDPIPWGGQFEDRVASTLGNPVFAAAFALFPAFILLEALAAATDRRSPAGGRDGGRRPALLIAGLTLALALDLSTLVLAGSRGPLIALVVGFGVLGALWWILPAGTAGRGEGPILGGRGGRRVWALALMVTAMVSAGVLLGARASGARGTAPVARLGTALDPAVASTRVRLYIWEGVMRLFESRPAQLSDGSTDRFAALRPLIGYGPETLPLALGPFVPAGLARLTGPEAVPDRSHNESFDALVTTGGLGLAAFVVLTGAALLYAANWLGLIGSRRQLVACVAAAACGAAAWIAIVWSRPGGKPLAGLALVPLLLAGFLALVLQELWSERRGRGALRPETPAPALLAALAAAIVAHLVEIHVGIAVTATRAYFWFFLAAIVTVGRGWLATEEPERAGPEGATEASLRPEWSASLTHGILTGLLLVAAIYGVYTSWQSQSFFDATVPPAAAIETARRLASGRTGILLLASLSWACASLLYLLEPRSEPGGMQSRGRLRNLDLFALASLGTLCFVGLWLTSRLTSLSLAVHRGEPNEITSCTGGLVRGVYAIVLVLVLLLALALWWRAADRRPWCARPWWWMAIAGTAILTACGWAMVRSSLRGVTADALLRQAVLRVQAKQFRASLALASAAVSLSPDEDQIRLLQANLLLASWTESLPEAREQVLVEALAATSAAYGLSPLYPRQAGSLARAYLLTSELSADKAAGVARAREAAGYYTKALVFLPEVPRLHLELARACLRSGDPARAEAEFRRATELDAASGAHRDNPPRDRAEEPSADSRRTGGRNALTAPDR